MHTWRTALLIGRAAYKVEESGLADPPPPCFAWPRSVSPAWVSAHGLYPAAFSLHESPSLGAARAAR